MPMREIRKKYTRSDLALLSWDSRQKSYNMTKNMRRPSLKSADGEDVSSDVSEDSQFYRLPTGVNNGVPIMKKWFGEDGQLDLRKATGDQACNYLQRLGLNIVPVMN